LSKKNKGTRRRTHQRRN